MGVSLSLSPSPSLTLSFICLPHVRSHGRQPDLRLEFTLHFLSLPIFFFPGSNSEDMFQLFMFEEGKNKYISGSFVDK